jgi:hypothetical protein
MDRGGRGSRPCPDEQVRLKAERESFLVIADGPRARIRATCRFTDATKSTVATDLELSTSPVSEWSAVHRIRVPAGTSGVRRARLELLIDSEVSWSLTSERQLETITAPTLPPGPVGRFVVVRSGGRLRRLEFPWAARLELARRGAELFVAIDLLDAEACGLGRWGPTKLSPSVPPDLEVFEDVLDGLDDCMWIEPYPEGARAALCITDHPDFDTVEKLRPLLDLFRRLELRVTKGVFPVRDPLGAKQEPGLDVPNYRALVEELFEAGSEIAFHGIGPRPRAPEPDEFRRRLELLRPFSPTTWIDHGVGGYLFTRQARLGGGESLVDLLTEAGIVNYWGYVDNWSNPFGDLRSDSFRSDLDALAEFLRAMAVVTGSARGAKGLLYPAAHLANNLLGENGALAVRGRPLAGAAWRVAGSSRRSHRAGCERPMPIYGTDGRAPGLTGGPLWVFDTVLLSHPAFQLSPSAVDRLCGSSGYSLVHCYLTCTHPYIGGGCFARGSTSSLHAGFVASLEHVAQRQRDGELCVLPFRDLRAALSSFGRTRLERTGEGWKFSAGSDGGRTVVGGSRAAIGKARCEKGEIVGGRHPRLRVPAQPGLVVAL